MPKQPSNFTQEDSSIQSGTDRLDPGPDSQATGSRIPGNRRLVAALLVVISLVAAWNVRQVVMIWQDEAVHTNRHTAGNSAATLVQLGSGTRQASPPFDLSNSTVPAGEIRSGGPPKDGIPALTNPAFVKGADAGYLQPTDRVIGFTAKGEARAYPLKILNYHEIVNDKVSGLPIAVTYCPLCDSVAVFDRQTPIGLREFGVSGLLYNSNVLMYDRAGTNEGLWSQLKSEGIAGPGAQQQLNTLPVELVTWQEWLERHPDTLVLASNTGHPRDYTRDPYAGYFEQPGLMFPVRPVSDRLPTKERVLGVSTANSSKAYPLSAFSRDRKRVTDTVDGKQIAIEFNPDTKSLRVVESDAGIEWMYSLWFAWHAMHSDTDVFK